MSLAGRLLTLLTEGDARRGMGHLTRCRGYAQAWRERGGTVSWVVDGDDLARRILADEAEVDWRAWQAGGSMAARSDAVLVDSYSVGSEASARLAASARRAVFLDDLLRETYPAGAIVVHGSPGPLPPGAAAWRTGPGWHPMRRAFWDMSARRETPARIGRLLITAGGADSRSMAERMVRAARRALPEAAIDLIVGGAASEAAVADGVAPHVDVPAEDMRDLMLGADAALTAAGQTIYELARCGCPAVLVGVAENQRRHMRHWPETGAGLGVGWWNDGDLDALLVAALTALTPERRATMTTAGQALVDGQGCRRLVAELETG